jgi:hypothetical protein
MTAAEVAAVARAADALLTPEEAGAGFAKKYFDALHGSPDVAMAHAAARRAISALGGLPAA